MGSPASLLSREDPMVGAASRLYRCLRQDRGGGRGGFEQGWTGKWDLKVSQHFFSQRIQPGHFRRGKKREKGRNKKDVVYVQEL